VHFIFVTNDIPKIGVAFLDCDAYLQNGTFEEIRFVIFCIFLYKEVHFGELVREFRIVLCYM